MSTELIVNQGTIFDGVRQSDAPYTETVKLAGDEWKGSV